MRQVVDDTLALSLQSAKAVEFAKLSGGQRLILTAILDELCDRGDECLVPID
jgi:hypothetical protein